ncbi:MAG: 4,5-DOPA dioxygenase extradiol [Pseudomonadota bacterium]
MSGETSARLPVVFFGHGSPTNVLEDNVYTRDWAAIGSALPKPQAILCVSAHWFTRGTGVTAMAQPRTIHDFGPLDDRLFQQQYSAPGSPDLARHVQSLLAPTTVALDQQWGFDHGCWSVLSKAFPGADIPIVQLSIDGTQPPQWHYDLAQKLRPLRDEGVLIVCSGNIVHNLRTMEWNETAVPYDWATAFADFMVEGIKAGEHDAIIAYESRGPHAGQAAPDRDHFYPILYALGASTEDDAIAVRTNQFQFKSINMASFVFGHLGDTHGSH